MKKTVMISSIFLFLLSMSIISAAGVEIHLTKEEYYQSQLLQAEIIGNFPEELDEENIAVYRGDQVHSTPVESELLKAGNKYFYYAVLPAFEGNYSIKITDTKYYLGQEILEDDVIRNFTITSTLDPYWSVNKGFIVTTKDFEITVHSLNAIQEITVKFAATGQEETAEVGYNAKKKLEFSIEDIEEFTESTLEVAEYTIPVFIFPEEVPPEPFINVTDGDEEPIDNETDEIQDVDYEDATPQQIQTCEDVGGQICRKGEICEGQISPAEGVRCCMGQCVEKPRSYAWIGGILILILLAAGIYWFYTKSKKAADKRKKTLSEFKEKTEKYQERIHPSIETQEEVRKKLGRT